MNSQMDRNRQITAQKTVTRLQKGWKRTLYRCVPCGTSEAVETVGEIISGPICRKCRKPMRIVKPEKAGVQSTLGLE